MALVHWTHLKGSSAIVQGAAFNFDAIDSLRWQMGAKWLRKTDERTTLRTGLVYQETKGDGSNDSQIYIHVDRLQWLKGIGIK